MTTTAPFRLRYDLDSHEELTTSALELIEALTHPEEDYLDTRLYFAIREMEDSIERFRERERGQGILPELSKLLQHQLATLALQHAANLQRTSLRRENPTPQVEPKLLTGQWYDTEGMIIPLTKIASWAMGAWTMIAGSDEDLAADAAAQDAARIIVGSRIQSALAR